jgi:hypothetical protein
MREAIRGHIWQPNEHATWQPNQIAIRQWRHLVSRGRQLLGARLLCPLNVALGLGREILELSQIRRLMRGAIRRAQVRSGALRAISVPPRHAYLGHQFGLETAAEVIQSALSGGT